MGGAALTRQGAKQQNPEWKPTGETAADLQGIAISAYPAQLFAMLVMVRFPASAAAAPNAWVSQVTPRITDSTGAREVCLNLAFSAAGLAGLGLQGNVMATFSRPFQEGMTTDNRSRFLKDEPAEWKWSDCAANANCVHAQLMIYALNRNALDSVVDAEVKTISGFGLIIAGQILQQVNLDPNNRRHEHFGFADGISQPILVDGEIPVDKRGLHEIPVGEVVLGQINTYGVPAPGPVVPASPIALQTLKPAATEGFFDLGLNGTYIVLRQLRQDVAKFWNSMRIASADLLDENRKPATDQWLAQKAVGRTLSGEMLTPTGSVNGNDLTFFASDPNGFGCPLTSHVRRANPRDGLAPGQKDTQDMINAANRHRIMRRGRIYGTPISDRYVDDGVDRGLVFLCMNSEIERQFEFAQHTWLLNPMFGLGYNEGDPILATKCPFSIPSKPVRQQPIIETFITPVGGGYFFLPSLRALRYLGALR
jgi:Dyp-type peroxidase family